MTPPPAARRHVLDLDDYSRDELAATLESAHSMAEVLGRDIKKTPALRGRVIVTMFYEASTRTRISFEEAGKVLSADVINMSASASSADKGESLLNTGLTLQAMGVDTLVVRHPHSGAPNFLARHLERVSVVNAGDGLHAHPTQALLDLYTVQSRFSPQRPRPAAETAAPPPGNGYDNDNGHDKDNGHDNGIEGRKIVIVGDVLHSRVARSNIWGFTRMGARVVLSGPPTLIPPDLMPASLAGTPGDAASSCGMPPVSVDTNLDRAVEDADVVMALRLQSERQRGGFLPSVREYIRRWQVNDARLARARPDALVMHPGPMNEGIEISTDLAHGGRSVIEEQVTAGVAVRMAVLYQLNANGEGF